MYSTTKSVWARARLLFFCAGAVCVALAQNPSQQQQSTSRAGSFQGKRTFTSTCAQCHGLDGKGSERAPNIADRANVQRLSDEQIFHIIQNGVPGTGMPAFHALQSAQIRAVVAYLRTLQGKTKVIALPGNPERGKEVFFGKAGCSECHMIAGQGGFIASDLSDYARTHDTAQIKSAIINPDGNGRPVRLLTATLRTGEAFTGRVRNEDNFSLQLQSLDGSFHFLQKAEIEKVESDPKTLMPSDYGSRLGEAELNDVISYLIKTAGGNTNAGKKSEEWEQ